MDVEAVQVLKLVLTLVRAFSNFFVLIQTSSFFLLTKHLTS